MDITVQLMDGYDAKKGIQTSYFMWECKKRIEGANKLKLLIEVNHHHDYGIESPIYGLLWYK